ncbi:MAG: hypothetical protein H6607_08810 [Flavobacteriales bacterium]|nr:hypothetical protein [Flavobacteriales bacterium]
MKLKIKYVLLIIASLVAIAALITNPSETKIKKYLLSVDSKTNGCGEFISAEYTMINENGNKVDYKIERKNYYLFSQVVFIINEKKITVGIAAFDKVWSTLGG